jgi:hypothetical protein
MELNKLNYAFNNILKLKNVKTSKQNTPKFI